MRLLILTALSMLSSTPAFADELSGRFTFLGENQCAPFEGVLFDPPATAHILADHHALATDCDVRMQYALETQAAEYELELENLYIRHDALVSEYRLRVESLNRESDALANALKKQSKKNPVMWGAVGVVSGIALSYGAYRTFNE